MSSGEAPLVLSLSHDVKLGTVSYITCMYPMPFVFGIVPSYGLADLTYNIPTRDNESATLDEVMH
jgi:hypothetical protein